MDILLWNNENLVHNADFRKHGNAQIVRLGNGIRVI